MRVICPFTDIHPETEAALTAFAPQAERIQVAYCDLPADCGNHGCQVPIRHCHHDRCQSAYRDLLVNVWGDARPTLLVEHDVELESRVVRSALHCPRPWCVWPYAGQGGGLIDVGLGCARFSASLMRAEPDAMARAGAIQQARGLVVGDWRRMDVHLLTVLRERGHEPHRHWPPVTHHHLYPGQDCACGRDHSGDTAC